MSKDNKCTIINAGLHALIGMGFSVTIGFGNPILTSLSLSSKKIGLLFALAMMSGIFIQMGFSVIVENKKLISIMQCIRVEAYISILLGILIIIFQKNTLIASIVFVIALAVSTSGFPTLGALSIDCINSDISLNFGISRAMGSIGYSIIGFTGGVIISKFGAVSLFNLYIIFNIIIIILTFLHPTYETGTKHKEFDSETIAYMLKNNKEFRKLIIGICFIFFSHNVINNFLNEIIRYVRATDVQYGIAVGISSFLELPTLVLFGIIIKKFTNISLLRISAIFMTLKVVIETFSVNFSGILLAMFMQPLAFALFTPAVIFYMNDIVKPNNQVKAQLMIGVASMGIGGSLGNIIGGILIDKFGINITMMIASCVSIIGVIIFMSLNKKRSN